MTARRVPRSSRPRVYCPNCKRSIAVTFNKRTGDAYIRAHTAAPGQPCKGSGRTVPPHMRNEPPFSMHEKWQAP